MSRIAGILIPACDAPTKFTLAPTTASSIQTFGKNRIFAINGDQDITILFGNAAGPSFTPDTTSFRIPANQQTTLDTGQAFDSFKVFNNNGSSSANVWIQMLTVV